MLFSSSSLYAYHTFVFFSNDPRHKTYLESQGIDFSGSGSGGGGGGGTTPSGQLSTYVDSLRIAGKDLVYDTKAGMYYCSVPSAVMNAESDCFTCLVAEKDGKIIGYVAFFYCYFTWSGKALYMDDLYITPDYRGKGLGTRFITMLKEIAAQSGCHIMRWQVADWNERARAIYKGIGAVINEEYRNCDIIL